MKENSQLWAWVMDVSRHPSLHRDALFLASATTVSGLGSLIYWKLITLRFSVEMIGLVSAAISSATFLSGLASMGLIAGLVRFIPDQAADRKLVLIRFVMKINLSTGLVVGLIFLVGRRWWAPELIPSQAGLIYSGIFMLLLLAIILMNVSTGVIQAERLTPYLLTQSMIINIVQIAGGGLVPISLGTPGVLFTYMLPVLVVALGFYFVLPHLAHFPVSTASALETSLLGGFLRYSLSTQVFNIVWSSPAIVFPLIVLAQLGAQANALLALSWYAYTFLAIIPNSIAVALLVDGAHEPGLLSRRLWDAFLINLVILVPVVLLTILIAPWLLGFFGNYYIRAALLLRLLAISIIPVSINGLYITRWRVRKQVFQLDLFVVLLTVGTVLLICLLIPGLGLDGIGWGWLAGQTLFAVPSLALIVRERWAARREVE